MDEQEQPLNFKFISRSKNKFTTDVDFMQRGVMCAQCAYIMSFEYNLNDIYYKQDIYFCGYNGFRTLCTIVSFPGTTTSKHLYFSENNAGKLEQIGSLICDPFSKKMDENILRDPSGHAIFKYFVQDIEFEFEEYKNKHLNK
jgi:hypothetical protein